MKRPAFTMNWQWLAMCSTQPPRGWALRLRFVDGFREGVTMVARCAPCPPQLPWMLKSIHKKTWTPAKNNEETTPTRAATAQCTVASPQHQQQTQKNTTSHGSVRSQCQLSHFLFDDSSTINMSGRAPVANRGWAVPQGVASGAFAIRFESPTIRIASPRRKRSSHDR